MNEKNEQIIEEVFSDEDIEKNKNMAGLAYLLFFLPLITCPESRFARFHANQSLVLWIAILVGNIILGLIPFIGWILIPLYNLAALGFGVWGLVEALNGKTKKLPGIGEIKLLR